MATKTRSHEGAEVLRLREDAGITQRRLAVTAGISPSHLCEIESGQVEASIQAMASLSEALGGRLRIRIEPGMGPAIRDHLQSAMVEALLLVIHPRWASFPEVAIHRPVRGFIDLVLADRETNVLVAVEFHSQLRRLEQQLRWANDKAEALRSMPDLAPTGSHGHPPTISRLLVLRSTRATRTIVDGHPQLLGAAYPAAQRDVLVALAGDALWPGAGAIWMTVEGGRARVIDRRG